MASSTTPFEDGKQLGSILEVNQLDYRLPPSLSVAVSRSNKSYPAHREKYTASTGESLIATFTSGGQYVDLLNSYLRFTVESNQPFRIPSKQSFLNLFSGIRLVHSSGEEIDRINLVMALWNKIRLGNTACIDRCKSQLDLFHYNCKETDVIYDNNLAAQVAPTFTISQSSRAVGYGALAQFDYTEATQILAIDLNGEPANELNTDLSYTLPIGQYISIPAGAGGAHVVFIVSGYPSPGSVELKKLHPDALTSDTVAITDIHFLSKQDSRAKEFQGHTSHEVVIPLWCLHDFFNKYRLAPVFLVSGLRLELDLEKPQKVFPSEHEDIDFTIKNATIDLESIAVADGVARRLAQISGARGLVWNWQTVFTSTTYPKQINHSVQITKAVSRANQAIFHVRNREQLATAKGDALASASHNYQYFDFSEYQFALGAEFMPVKPMTSAKEFHHSNLKCWEQFRRVDELAPHSDDNDTGTLMCASTSLETSTTLGQSGVAINAQRTAVATMNFVDDNDKPVANQPANEYLNQRQVDLFLTAEKVALIMLDSISLRS